METALAELPLAVFTTLAPIGAGAFIALAIAFTAGKFSDEQLKAIDKMTLVPFVVAAIGFIASMAHAANPAHAFGIFTGLGSSPLSNEDCIGLVFMLVALVYVILALAGKLGGARKGLAIVVAVLGAVFALFVGAAYMIPTVQSWDSVLVPLQMLGFALAGGVALGALVLMLAKVGDEAFAPLSKPFTYVAIAGGVLALVGIIGFAAMVSGQANAVQAGSALLGAAAPCLVIGTILIVVSVVEVVLACRKGMASAAAIRATVEAIVGVFLVRLAFYALYLSVGVTMM